MINDVAARHIGAHHANVWNPISHRRYLYSGLNDYPRIPFQLVRTKQKKQLALHIGVIVEARVQVSAMRYRIPDVCVMSADVPRSNIIDHPPILCIEVLSPRDSVAAMRRRAQDYFDMGVGTVWIFDPTTRTAYVCTPDGMDERKDGTLSVRGSMVQLAISEVFKTLDKR